MLDGHCFDAHRGLLSDKKHAVGSFPCILVSLDNRVLGSLSLDGDIFVHHDACFGVNSVSDIDYIAGDRPRIVNGRLDGGEIATSSAHSDWV
jgi:hypothetical protein